MVKVKTLRRENIRFVKNSQDNSAPPNLNDRQSNELLIQKYLGMQEVTQFPPISPESNVSSFEQLNNTTDVSHYNQLNNDDLEFERDGCPLPIQEIMNN